MVKVTDNVVCRRRESLKDLKDIILEVYDRTYLYATDYTLQRKNEFVK